MNKTINAMKNFNQKKVEQHKELIEKKFPHAEESLLYNSGGNAMWSLFRTGSGSVTIYYHDLEDFDILPSKTKYIDLKEIADNWNASTKQLNI